MNIPDKDNGAMTRVQSTKTQLNAPSSPSPSAESSGPSSSSSAIKASSLTLEPRSSPPSAEEEEESEDSDEEDEEEDQNAEDEDALPPPINPTNPLQRLDPRLPPPGRQTPIREKDEAKLLGLYLSVASGNPSTYSHDHILRAQAVITNFRTLMSEMTASGAKYNVRAKRDLRFGEWGVLIGDAFGVLRSTGVKIGKWEGGQFEDWLDLEEKIKGHDRFVLRGREETGEGVKGTMLRISKNI
jgi:hypothetical protein